MKVKLKTRSKVKFQTRPTLIIQKGVFFSSKKKRSFFFLT